MGINANNFRNYFFEVCNTSPQPLTHHHNIYIYILEGQTYTMPLHRQYLLFVVLVLVHVLDSVCAAVSETPYRPSARVKEYHDFSKGWKALKKNKGGGVVYILYVYVLSLARSLSSPSACSFLYMPSVQYSSYYISIPFTAQLSALYFYFHAYI